MKSLYKKLDGMTEADIKAKLRKNPGFFTSQEVPYIEDWLENKATEKEVSAKKEELTISQETNAISQEVNSIASRAVNKADDANFISTIAIVAAVIALVK